MMMTKIGDLVKTSDNTDVIIIITTTTITLRDSIFE